MSHNPRRAGEDGDVAVVLQGYEARDLGDIDRAVAALHPDVAWIEPEEFLNGGRHRGRAAVADYLRKAGLSGPYSPQSEPLTAVAAASSSCITSSGAWVDGSAHDMTGADVSYTVHGGQVVRMQAYADPSQASA